MTKVTYPDTVALCPADTADCEVYQWIRNINTPCPEYPCDFCPLRIRAGTVVQDGDYDVEWTNNWLARIIDLLFGWILRR